MSNKLFSHFSLQHAAVSPVCSLLFFFYRPPLWSLERAYTSRPFRVYNETSAITKSIGVLAFVSSHSPRTELVGSPRICIYVTRKGEKKIERKNGGTKVKRKQVSNFFSNRFATEQSRGANRSRFLSSACCPQPAPAPLRLVELAALLRAPWDMCRWQRSSARGRVSSGVRVCAKSDCGPAGELAGGTLWELYLGGPLCAAAEPLLICFCEKQRLRSSPLPLWPAWRLGYFFFFSLFSLSFSFFSRSFFSFSFCARVCINKALLFSRGWLRRHAPDSVRLASRHPLGGPGSALGQIGRAHV